MILAVQVLCACVRLCHVGVNVKCINASVSIADLLLACKKNSKL